MNLAQLEARSNAAAAARDKAVVLLVKLDALIAAVAIVEGAVDDPALTPEIQQAAWVSSPERSRKALEPVRAALIAKIDALETEAQLAAKELNDAPDDAV